MDVPGCLGSDGLQHARMAVAQRVYGDAAEHIQIAFAVGGEQIGAFAADDLEWQPFVGVEKQFAVAFVQCHGAGLRGCFCACIIIQYCVYLCKHKKDPMYAVRYCRCVRVYRR